MELEIIDNCCSNCDLHIRDAYCPTRGEGSEVTILFISPSASSKDVKVKHPFSGRYSSIIFDLIKAYEIKQYVSLTNLIKCYSRSTTEYIIDKCIVNLISDIKYLKPNIIVTFGEVTYRRVTGNTDFNRVRGKLVRSGKYVIFAMPHLYVYHTTKEYDILVKLFNKLSKWISTKDKYYIPVEFNHINDISNDKL